MKKTFVTICLVLLTAQASPRNLTIAAASDLNFAFKELAAGFEKKTGQHVRMTFGSSGNFFAQIQNGAPFDLYFSADIEYPRKLESAGLAEPGTLYKYAVGRIVIWVPRDSKIDVAKLGMKSLLDSSVRKIAIANPRHAPYGRAAVAAMEHFGVYQQVENKLVLGENISQTAQFVESGSAEIGIIALSLAVAPPMKEKGKFWEVPQSAYPPIEQGAVIVKSSPSKQSAASFLDYVNSAEGVALMRRYGFTLPAEAPKTK
ncbi:MAG: molybdate ABC transporter substrate-binding protein [Acidobacteria bacterium]|nr:molybdate ABC transporter substrate-binding protein [Acidobacteriota bacterium]